MIKLRVNNKDISIDIDGQTPLLWVLRDTLKLKGTKFGCGAGLCGACTVHVDGEPVRSCSFPVSAVGEREITTIDGLSDNADHPVQQAWQALRVSQCGYCQSGMIMSATALLNKTPNPTDADIDREMTNICRCGSYPRVRDAIKNVARSITLNNTKGVKL